MGGRPYSVAPLMANAIHINVGTRSMDEGIREKRSDGNGDTKGETASGGSPTRPVGCR